MSSLANTAVAGLAITETLLALLAVKTQEQARLLVTMMCLSIGAVLGFALIFLSALVIVAFWDSHRLLTTGVVARSFALLALALFGTSVYLRRTRPRWLSSIISKIAKDIGAIRSATQ